MLTVKKSDNIGALVRRKSCGTKYHLIESQIGDRTITRCGRQMKETDKKGNELEILRGVADHCKTFCDMCWSGQSTPPVVAEAATGGVEAPPAV
jgi:hypothetical protein